MPAATRASDRAPSAPTTSRTRASPPAYSTVTPAASGLIASAGAAMRGNFSVGGAGFERRQEISVLDVVTEGIEPDFRGVERDLGRAKQPLRIVDDAKPFKRRGMRQAGLPRAQRFQRGDGTRQEAQSCGGRARRGGAIKSVSTPAVLSAMAQTRPAGPPPTTATSAVIEHSLSRSSFLPLARCLHACPVIYGRISQQ